MAGAGRKAAEYLAGKIDDLRAYQYSTLGGTGAVAAAATAAGVRGGKRAASPSPTAKLAPPTYEELKAHPLPLGWHWVRVEDIETTLRSHEALKWGDGQREWLTGAYRRLLTDVMPMVDRNRDASHDRITRDDHARGIFDTSGKLGVFDTFFQTGEPIHLQRGPNGLWVPDGGRHRIDTARQLGWPAVPAQTQGP
jgi:hypothetical protein